MADKEIALIKTTEGDMVAEFWPEVAPKTVENFKKLARQGFYDGTCFHRVIKGFMIQGGDPNTKDPAKESSWGTGGPGHTVKAEFNDRKHVRGVFSMARSNDPDSAGSQFFICHGNATFLDVNTPPLASSSKATRCWRRSRPRRRTSPTGPTNGWAWRASRSSRRPWDDPALAPSFLKAAGRFPRLLAAAGAQGVAANGARARFYYT